MIKYSNINDLDFEYIKSLCFYKRKVQQHYAYLVLTPDIAVLLLTILLSTSMVRHTSYHEIKSMLRGECEF